MEVLRTIHDMRACIDAARRAGRRIGFVPTMGALHRGHVSLFDAAERDGAFVVVSIFVNPLQFGPGEDLARYPRDEEGDLRICRAARVDAVFLPAVEDMYPPGSVTTIRVAKLTDTLCGPFRPGHFEGVATIVAKLFNIVRPDIAYFGEKDAQQLAVIRRMVRDLDMPIDVVGCPIVREEDGLALSSRNAYLNEDERRRATALSRALQAARAAVARGERSAAALVRDMTAIIAAVRPTAIDYLSVVDAETLQPVHAIDGPVLVAVAVRFGGTRLIDNVRVDPHHPAE